MKINFVNNLEIDVAGFEKTIKHVFKYIKDKSTMSVIFVSKDEIQRINKEYRDIDKVTDVISFALNDSLDLIDEIKLTKELGDVFICVDRAKEQANEYSHSIEREMGFLAVHGYLHLKGYDHMNEDDEKLMFAMQDEILNKAKLLR